MKYYSLVGNSDVKYYSLVGNSNVKYYSLAGNSNVKYYSLVCNSNVKYDSLIGNSDVKLGFPMAASTTFLEWGLLRYKDAYKASGQLDKMYDCVRWPLEWLLKSHTRSEEVYFRVHELHFQVYKDLVFTLCRGNLWRVRLAKQETLTHPGHLVSPLVCRGP